MSCGSAGTWSVSLPTGVETAASLLRTPKWRNRARARGFGSRLAAASLEDAGRQGLVVGRSVRPLRTTSIATPSTSSSWPPATATAELRLVARVPREPLTDSSGGSMIAVLAPVREGQHAVRDQGPRPDRHRGRVELPCAGAQHRQRDAFEVLELSHTRKRERNLRRHRRLETRDPCAARDDGVRR